MIVSDGRYKGTQHADGQKLITRLAGDCMTIIVSSHILAELEDYSTRMLMLRDGAVGLSGHVVCSRPGKRLSYVLHSGPTDPPTYLTWLIRPSADGTTINFAIDEPETPDTIEDAEDTWLPVLEALQQHLRAQRSPHAH